MKDILYEKLDSLTLGKTSILEVVDKVAKLRETITDEKELTEFVNYVRDIVQLEAAKSIITNGGKGLIVMATGAGKSKVAIELASYYATGPEVDVIFVPTEKLRDENWKEEFNKWGRSSLYEYSEKYCYASAHKISGNQYGLAILDEAHNITENVHKFFLQNRVTNIVALTATEPEPFSIKKQLLDSLGLKVVYKLSLDDAVKLGFVAPYKIVVVKVPLDEEVKDVSGGTKYKPFLTTERAHYNSLSNQILRASPASKMFHNMNRMHFIYQLKSKQVVAKFILDNLIPEDDRVLIFASGIVQAELLCEDSYHSKSNNVAYDAFKSGQINRLSCVKAINEGHNLPSVDKAVVCQVTSKDKDLVQRIGRIIRFRPGHEALVYIVVAEGTQDEVWLNKALMGIDQNKVEYTTFINLKEKYNAIRN